MEDTAVKQLEPGTHDNDYDDDYDYGQSGVRRPESATPTPELGLLATKLRLSSAATMAKGHKTLSPGHLCECGQD